jgi:TonB family protein
MPVVRPKLIRRNAPQYPPLALRDGVEGWVTLKFQLSPEGVPFNQAVHQSSDLVFDQASLRAVAGCRYEPAPKGSNLYGGRWFYIRYRFLVEGSPLPPNGQLPDTSDGPLAN